MVCTSTLHNHAPGSLFDLSRRLVHVLFIVQLYPLVPNRLYCKTDRPQQSRNTNSNKHRVDELYGMSTHISLKSSLCQLSAGILVFVGQFIEFPFAGAMDFEWQVQK